MRSSRLLAATFLSAALVAAPLFTLADDTPATKTDAKTADKGADKATEKAPPTEVTTEGSVDAGGQHIAYTAVAGTITVGSTDVQDAQLGMDGKPIAGSELAISEPKEPKDATAFARMFYVAYFKKDAKAEDRPITFFYNGGPGSSTVWLHMGSLGPRHVVTDTDQHLPAAPYKMVDNADSLLESPGERYVPLAARKAGENSKRATSPHPIARARELGYA